MPRTYPPKRAPYRFSHRGADGRYYWTRPVPNDSRAEVVSCPVEWFWSTSGA